MTRRQEERRMKLIGSVVVILCAVALIGIFYTGNREVEAQGNSGQTLMEVSSILTDMVKEETLENLAPPEKLLEELPDDWNLILVNQTHPIPDDYEVSLMPIGSGHQINARAYNDYCEMIAAAKSEGIYIYVTSSYRDLDKQIKLHNEKIEEYKRLGYSDTEAKELAAQVVAIPGTSEHHLGLALDLVSSEYRRLDEGQERTKGFQWLKEHCSEYGFILRYPNGKTQITGIIYEPWHFRYVGKKTAKEIARLGLTLEEYLGASPVFEEGYQVNLEE